MAPGRIAVPEAVAQGGRRGPDPLPGAVRAIVLCNGPLTGPASVRRQIAPAKGWLVVTADGGLRHAGPLGLRAHVAVGDFDSSPVRRGAAALELRHPRDKDETDLELAMDYVASRPRIRRVVLVGAMGGRLDHSLANVDLAARLAGTGRAVSFVDGSYRLSFVSARLSLERIGRFDAVSLLPHSESVEGIVTRGLEFPLAGESLVRGFGRGVSNTIRTRRASIRVGSGLLMVIQTSTVPPRS